ncbi:MarR family transcriptional regulator [Pseudovibrio sp. Tun.PSC04-5.I4]|uniref:MarR family transcriptional regulator n=1 Tax=Pseudovibrio sp. Tun.PSC04-5.I4 TaxID=1798213 RepID=UPI0008895421|nr:MarR family transcriptional regulator [Pseudovibrio sp. Tun.PSC04-5.I4]SDR31690.1 DNA-binding transcriptional regulator, MarR family [Pseudovibrio sp. Tun.PSC04-5.I4]
MSFNFKKSTTFRLAQAAKAQRARSGAHLSRIGLHPGQEAVLKILNETDGKTMSQLALALGVQPPTVTKMVTRLAAQGLVFRKISEKDGRLARVFLTEEGRARIFQVDRAWKRLEKEALVGLDDKDRKRLRRLLRQVEKNLSASFEDDPDLEEELEADAQTAEAQVEKATELEVAD